MYICIMNNKRLYKIKRHILNYQRSPHSPWFSKYDVGF